MTCIWILDPAGEGPGEPFIYAGNGNPSAVSMDTPYYKSLFLGFPLEWIGNLDDRTALLHRTLVWMCGPWHVYLPLTAW